MSDLPALTGGFRVFVLRSRDISPRGNKNNFISDRYRLPMRLV
jgi:hypothetical protein